MMLDKLVTDGELQKKRGRKTYSAPALEKGLDIIEMFAAEGEPMTTSTIANKLDRSIGEIFRMLMVLEQRGYITSADDDKYFLTLKLYTVGSRYAPIKRLTAAASDVMHSLAEKTHQSCHLVVYGKGRGIVIAHATSPADRIHTVRLGAEAPLLNSCSGHLLLAYAKLESRRQMLDEQPEHLRGKIGKGKLQEITEVILQRGYESVPSAQVAGVQDIGYPIFDDSGKFVAALVLPYLQFIDGSQKVTMTVARQSLAQAASRISQSMGFNDAD